MTSPGSWNPEPASGQIANLRPMLISMTRTGAGRHSVGKQFTVHGVSGNDVSRIATAFDAQFAGFATLVPDVPVMRSASPQPWTLETEWVWLGIVGARDDFYRQLSHALLTLARSVRSVGGRLWGCGFTDAEHPLVSGTDTHYLEVLSPTAQEVLCNALRKEAPTLIAATAHPGIQVARTADIGVGSRHLAASRNHLATRYLASAEPRHLERVRDHLRVTEGVASLDRMDVFPTARNGVNCVAVRCTDATASLETLRAVTLLLDAVSVGAFRVASEGRRMPNIPHQMLDANRARAIAAGLNATFELEAASGPRRGKDDGRDRSATDGRPTRQVRSVTARKELGRWLRECAPAFRNLDATAAELLPLLAPAELVNVGVRRNRTDTELLASYIGAGTRDMGEVSRDMLIAEAHSRTGGTLRATLTRDYPGRVAGLLGDWDERIGNATYRSASTPDGRRRQGGPPDRGKRGRPGTGQGTSRGERRASDPRGGGNRDGSQGRPRRDRGGAP
jgi:hypothetical protein